MRFGDIIGQGELKAKLAAGVDRGRISHAQLFAGGSGSGALALAIAYAQYVNCTGRSGGDSCGQCPSCRKIGELAHPDLHFVFPVNTSKGKSSAEKPLSKHFLPVWRETVAACGGYMNEPAWYEAIEIDNKQGNISTFEADEIIKELSFKSFEAEYKIVLIWLPERMNVQAANKLLKILEEPWDKTLFLMVCESPDQLLPTIISRTQSVTVPAVGDEDMTRWLINTKGVAPADAPAVVRLAGGSVMEALRVLGSEAENSEHFELFVQLMRLSYEDRHLELLDWADSVASMGREAQKRFIAYAIRLLRDSYMLTAGVPEISYLFGKEYEFCRKFAPFVNNSNIEQIIAEMELVVKHVSWNGNPRIIFPHFALTVSKLINRLP